MNRSRMAFALVAPVLVLGGCSDDPVPKVAPHESPSVVSESPSPTGPVEPTMPAAAKKHTAAGAEAFVKFYVVALNYAQATGSLATFRKLSTDHCAACSGYLQAINKTYGSGGHVQGGTLTIGRLRKLPKDYGADWGAFAKGRATPQVIIDGSGRRQRYPGGAFSLYAYTIWTGSTWQMQWMRTPS